MFFTPEALLAFPLPSNQADGCLSFQLPLTTTSESLKTNPYPPPPLLVAETAPLPHLSCLPVHDAVSGYIFMWQTGSLKVGQGKTLLLPTPTPTLTIAFAFFIFPASWPGRSVREVTDGAQYCKGNRIKSWLTGLTRKEGTSQIKGFIKLKMLKN